MAKLLDVYRRRNAPASDYWLLGGAFALALIGLLMIMSSSVIVSFERYGSNYNFLTRQAISLLVGVVALIVTSMVDYRFWRKHAVLILVTAMLLLVAVFIPGIGTKIGGAQRWIGLGPITVQPSEILKLAFIIYLAAWLESKGKQVAQFREGVMPFLVLVGIGAILVLKQPDLGTVLVVTAVSAVMFYVSGANVAHMFSLGLAGIVLLFFLVRSAAYRWTRFLTFLNPNADALGAGYQVNQALLAIGTGGWFGLGFGQSRQKYLYLPQPHVDSIFAVMVEELGFLRIMPILFLYAFVILRGLRIAKTAPDQFGQLIAVGITAWILVQVFVNVGAISGLLPLTGVPLPFISFGGTSLVMLFAGTGILLNISKQVTK